MNNTAIILTKNEEIHIERCIRSILPIFKNIYVVDSFSEDRTQQIAKELPVKILENSFLNHSSQFNWSLNHIDKKTDWVLRIDADEYLSESLVDEIAHKLPNLDKDIKGIFVPRKIIFQERLIKYGGFNNNKILRLFRFGYGKSDNRWMDEHIIINGETITFSNPIIDHNLKPLSWWISKHNNYANKEVYEIIKNEVNQKEIKNGSRHYKSYFNRKRYYAFPVIIRTFLYFIYRYFFRLGFLDGIEGFTFHFLQGLWYRLLVDIKYLEVKRKIKNKNISFRKVIKNNLFIDIND